MGVKNAAVCGYDLDSYDVLRSYLKQAGFSCEPVDDFEPSLPAVRNASLICYHLSGGSMAEEKFRKIIEQIQILRIAHEKLPILCTSDGKNLDRIVQAVQAGATDHQKWEEPAGGLPSQVKKFIETMDSNGRFSRGAENARGFQGILGESVQIQRVFDLISKVSATSSTVLITGESGTGKELVCRAIHALGKRANNPLIPVNCGAIPEELLESELFGHEKGAFTGATTSREGRFQLADGGTIFLDEIGEMSPKLQVKLLRVLQAGEFERIGGAKTVRVDVRLIAATNIDLEEAVYQKRFREDLFYRLNVIPIHLPPLRERKEDICILIESFMNRFLEKGLTPLRRILPDALEALQEYPWPGNVRELENFIERMSILAEGPDLRMEDLPEKISHFKPPVSIEAAMPEVVIPDEGIDLKSTLEEVENRLILKALEKCGGVKNRAAQLLGLNRTTLVEKLKKKNLDLAKPK